MPQFWEGPLSWAFLSKQMLSQVLKERRALSGPRGISWVGIPRYVQIPGGGERKWLAGPVVTYLEPGENPACEGLWAKRSHFQGLLRAWFYALEQEAHGEGCFLSRTRGRDVDISIGGYL